jgi:hypothetical protein
VTGEDKGKLIGHLIQRMDMLRQNDGAINPVEFGRIEEIVYLIGQALGDFVGLKPPEGK